MAEFVPLTLKSANVIIVPHRVI